ncbi:hypothetical protein [Nonomuraea typhae]|uniref:hypothetical protein n=1 Tax=Nonomuraea typhae TaxID=2603600 RepID=UPI0012FA1DDE|nr:hypothetical protein [Nonomuraea typhae]
MTVKCFATIVGAVLLATSTLAAPAQALASPAVTCERGGVADDGYGVLRLAGSPCSGLPGRVSSVEVLLKSGPDAGTYFCNFVFVSMYNAVIGLGCRRL